MKELLVVVLGYGTTYAQRVCVWARDEQDADPRFICEHRDSGEAAKIATEIFPDAERVLFLYPDSGNSIVARKKGT